MRAPRVGVVGAGVSGLSTALCLLERGARVRLLARERTPATTSDVPAAFWHPFMIEAGERALFWAVASFRRFAEMATEQPACGVRMREGDELRAAPAADPWWREAVTGFRRLKATERPDGRQDGWRFVAPIIETPRYMPWLERAVRERGATIESAAFGDRRDLAAATRDCDAVVICAGLGSRELCADPALYPSRGQLAWLEPVPGVDRFVIDAGDPAAVTYVIPRADAVVCGGTAEDGVEPCVAEPQVVAAILERARRLVPALREARVLRIGAGLRPCRPSVRLERDRLDDGRPLIYNYGHGGAGFSVSWGCAAEAAALVLGS